LFGTEIIEKNKEAVELANKRKEEGVQKHFTLGRISHWRLCKKTDVERGIADMIYVHVPLAIWIFRPIRSKQ